MQEVPQDPVFHAEGNVGVHTRMVMEALQELESFKSLLEQDQHMLMAAALLHDVEKRSTTATEADGRISSYGHAKKGELSSRKILYIDVPTPFQIREQICKLVRHHGLPLWVFDKPDPRKAVIQASLEVDTHQLALLAQADVLGRICNDKEELLYRIELFRELCREHNCYGKPREFSNPFSRFFYLRREDVAPDYIAYNDSKFEVILMCGLPGAGKDMYINFNLSNWPLVSPDELRLEMKIKPNDKSGAGRVIQRAKEKAKEFMRSRTSFVWNASNISRQKRQELVELFLTYGAYVKIIYLEAPYSLLLEQSRNREHKTPPTVMVKMLEKMEVPGIDEAHEVAYVIREAPDPEENQETGTNSSEE
jgi:predicted kinase